MNRPFPEGERESLRAISGKLVDLWHPVLSVIPFENADFDGGNLRPAISDDGQEGEILEGKSDGKRSRKGKGNAV